jgi:hypothetical protein
MLSTVVIYHLFVELWPQLLFDLFYGIFKIIGQVIFFIRASNASQLSL